MKTNSNFFTKTFLAHLPFEVGEYSYGHPEVYWWGEPVTLSIGRYCSFAAGVKIFLGGNHRTDWITTYPFSGKSLRSVFPEAATLSGHPCSKGNIEIGHDVWVGSDALIMSGVQIGSGAVVGAGAVVTRDVGPYEIVAGNPARSIGFRFNAEQREKLLQIEWWNWEDGRVRQFIPLLMNSNFEDFVRLASQKTVFQPSPPKILQKVHLEIVKGCQLRCVGCPNSTLNPKVKRIDVGNFRRILENIDVQEIKLLRLFNFGEPLLHPKLAEILDVIKSANQTIRQVEISTNAQFASWPDLERALSKNVLTRLVVSCDGNGTPEDYERLRPPSKWSKLIEFLDRVAGLREQLCPALELITRSVVESDEDRSRWNSILLPRGWLPEYRAGMALPEATISLAKSGPTKKDGLCGFMRERDRLYVDWDGTIVPCCAHPRASELGNLFENKFSTIFQGDQYDRMKLAMMKNRESMRICGECNL